MDYAAIALAVITALSPYVKKGLEKGVESFGELTAGEVFNTHKPIWDIVKGIFKADDLTLLNILETAQADDKAQGKLEGKLETHLEANPEIATQLQELLKNVPQNSDIKSYHVEIKDNAQVGAAIGQGNVEGDAFVGDKIQGDKYDIKK